MLSFNVSLFIVAVFLLLTLVVGVYFSMRKTTFQEYAIGKKQFATATLVVTLVATDFGGPGLFRSVSSIHVLGLYWIVVLVVDILLFSVLTRLMLRMGPFMGHLSMAETIGVYGKYPRIIAALVGICQCIVWITAQISVISAAFGMCMSSIDVRIPTVLATCLLIFYSCFGGVRAVVFTDVLQFITFSIIIPLLSWFVFLKVGKPISEIIPILQTHTKFQFSNLAHSKTELVSLLLGLLSCIPLCFDPPVMQRVYMSSSPMQARKVFLYSALFRLIIWFFIILIGLFVFVAAPGLPKETVWDYILAHIPSVFKGFVIIGLLAMSMSTADSCLNVSSVMLSYDIVRSLQNKKLLLDTSQLKVARWTILVVGVCAVLLSLYCQDLLILLNWSSAIFAPIIAAPFVLAVYGFRGTSRTVLIGMATGLLTILVHKWTVSLTKLYGGGFLAMVANGLAMMAAHYFLKQPENAGWVQPDNEFKQVQQENARKRAERKAAIKNDWDNIRAALERLMPSPTTMVCGGLYISVISLLTYFINPITNNNCCLILQLFIAACCLGHPFFYDISKKIRGIPNWCIGLFWLMMLTFVLPFKLIGYWWHLMDPIFSASLFLSHCALILWLLPLYLGVTVVAVTSLVAIYPIATGLPFSLLSSLFPLFIASLWVFSVVICLKINIYRYKTRILYLENQEKIRASQALKASLYDSVMLSSTTVSKAKGYGAILRQVIGKIEGSISFLDGNLPLYKEDFQSIINKLYDWVAYFNRRAKAKKHALLQPAKITLDTLVRKVELALAQEMTDPPRLLVTTISGPNGELSPYIICDIDQVVYLLVKIVLRIGKLEHSGPPIVRIQFHPTALQFRKADPIPNYDAAFMFFQATALVISQVATPATLLPKVEECYRHKVDGIDPQAQQEVSPSIDLEQQTISSIVEAHYGYWKAFGDEQQSMLLVLPNDLTDIFSNIMDKLPIDCLTSAAPLTSKEQADSMMVLMEFYDYVCKSSYQNDPVDASIIAALLLLLRQRFGFKRHASGQLFYVRAVGVAQLVVEWVFHSPKVIYASLLYELVRHTCLPLSYVKKHYNLGVYAFVSNVVKIDQHQGLDHPSLLYVQNRLKEALKVDHVQLSVLFIKLAERLYDLRHAAGYIHLAEVQHMAQEALAIDVNLAHTYLGPEIGVALEEAAKQALEVGKDIDKDKQKGKDRSLTDTNKS